MWNIKKAPIDILCINETGLGSTFTDAQVKIDGHQFPPFRKGRNAKCGGKCVFIRHGLIIKRLTIFKTKTAETNNLHRINYF